MVDSSCYIYEEDITTPEMKELANHIRLHLTSHKQYKIAYPLCIDELYFDCHIYRHGYIRIMSQYIFHAYNDATNHYNHHVVYQIKYKSIEHVLYMVKELANKYVIYNGQLKSPKYMRRIELEKNVFGQNEDMVCCVCFKDNCDKTTCGHNICLKCRTRIVIQYELQNKKRFVSPPCPVCRTKCVEFCINDIENSYNHFDDILRNMKCDTDCRCEECARVIFASDEMYDKYKIKKPKNPKCFVFLITFGSYLLFLITSFVVG
jgi:hypothetical protein